MIRNISRNTVLADRHRIAGSVFSKALGLMFRTCPHPVVFSFSREKINSLHMLFVFFPIDVLFLGKDRKVVEKKQNLLPFRFYTPRKKSMYVVELPAGTISSSRTDVGDSLEF